MPFFKRTSNLTLWSVLRILVILSIPMSSFLLRMTVPFHQREDYYPLWTYDLFATDRPSEVHRTMLKIYRVNETTYPEGVDFFKLFPTVDFFNLSPSVAIIQLAEALKKNNADGILSAKNVLERFTFAKRGNISYGVVECRAHPIEMLKTGLCSEEKVLARFEFIDQSRANTAVYLRLATSGGHDGALLKR